MHLGHLLLVCFAGIGVTALGESYSLPANFPIPPPPYMVDNQGNTHQAAPDKGTLDSAITNSQVLSEFHQNDGMFAPDNSTEIQARQSGYWYPGITRGISPYAPSGYNVFRNVKSFGAKGDGVTDDTVAINKAIVAGNRCGQSCGSTSVLYATIYFPPGVYLVSAPIIQYYYTQFIGDPTNKPTIKGKADFQGIALIDNDVYIPGGNGNEWYINQNQFYRTIKNFIIDLRLMPNSNVQGGQTYAPTGLHWQVAQATSLQNIDFIMPQTAGSKHVGIFMENGSGGFVSDLTFTGGNIGFRAGSQQFTARGLKFTNCATAISMVWDWGFTWQQITVTNCHIAIDLTSFGGASGQGTGSISVVDSSFHHVPGAIPYSASFVPNIVLDNLQLYQVPQVVFVHGQSSSKLAGPSLSSTSTQTVKSWAQGRRYTAASGTGTSTSGPLSPAPSKPAALLGSNGKWFTRSKPTYLSNPPTVIATNNGIIGDGTGDQSAAINAMLKKNVGKVIYFPAGIYRVTNTIFIPVGSIIIGEAWPQLMGAGAIFSDPASPVPVVKVGNPGDSGIIEMSELLFTVQGATAGAILLEWNVHEKTQGSAAMWDCHFRVGGAKGSNLQKANCPKLKGVNDACIAAAMLFHVTPQASGYFENVWAWTADHDLDASSGGASTTSSTQISIYSARGVLIESQGPSWFYGTASEHNVLYQYNLYKAKNIYLGHMQTETPYYQPSPVVPNPFSYGVYNSDPTYGDCVLNSCRESWALTVVNSTNVFVYSAGFYSFFSNYVQTCVPKENCQTRLIETSYTQGLWLYNVFTKGAVNAVSPQGLPAVLASANQHGYTTEISAYLALSISGGDLGNGSNEGGGYETCRVRGEL